MSIMVSARLDMVLPIDDIWILITIRQKVIRSQCYSTIGGVAYGHVLICVDTYFSSFTRAASLDSFKSTEIPTSAFLA